MNFDLYKQAARPAKLTIYRHVVKDSYKFVLQYKKYEVSFIINLDEGLYATKLSLDNIIIYNIRRCLVKLLETCK